MPEMDLEKELARTLERYLQDSPPNLADSIRYSLLAPGKRIRPRLALACARMIGLSPQAALPAGLAIEMIHCFTLIHDDLPCMDDDDFRRGRLSNHKVHGEAVALLAGDAMMMIALEVLAEAVPHVKAGNFARALRRFAWASGARGVIGGQAAESLLTPVSTLADLRRMHAQKTGALFSAALLLPKDLSGSADESIDRFAAELGLAFQVADDLEDGDQDKDLNKAAHEPTSILFYMSAEQAREQTIQNLQNATQKLSEAWGAQQASELTAIAEEVSRSLSSRPKGTPGK